MADIEGTRAIYEWQYARGGNRTIVRPVPDNSVCYTVLPAQAHLTLERAQQPSYVDSRIHQAPPTIFVWKSYDDRPDVLSESDYFPPEGPFEIYHDGTTNPSNLAELVQEVRDRGWTISEEVAAKLNLRP